MRFWKVLIWSLVILVVLALGAAGVLYILASKVPQAYKPARLDLEGREAAASEFWLLPQEFSNRANTTPVGESFQWTLTQDKLNRYLGSIDRISAKQGRDPAEAHEALDRAGVADPAVALDDGVLTFMFRASEYDKIISLDVRFDFLTREQVKVELEEVRIGVLPIARSFVRHHIAGIRKSLARRLDGEPRRGERAGGDPPATGPGGISPDDPARWLAAVVRAIDGRPVRTRTNAIGKKRIRIEGVRIEDGRIVLDVRRVSRRTAR